MQKDQQQPQTYCNSCGRYVLTSNFLIHQVRCQKNSSLKSSLISEKTQKKQNYNQNSSQNSRGKNLPRQVFSSNMKKNKPNPNIIQGDQKIPCYFCGYQQTFAQLDDHPKKCQHWQTQCQYCKSKFPKSLMADHKQVCQKNTINIQRRRQMEQSRPQYTRNHQYPNMFMRRQENIDNQQGFQRLFEQRMRNHISHNPLTHFFQGFEQINSRGYNQPMNIIQFSTGNNGSSTFVRMIRNDSSGGMGFFQLINMLANRLNPHPSQNPGLNSEQLKELKKVKYHKKENVQQPDLCAICFCEFEQNQQINELECKHLFHQECISQWLKRVSTCPVCKKGLNKRKLNESQNQQRFHQNVEQIDDSDDYSI